MAAGYFRLHFCNTIDALSSLISDQWCPRIQSFSLTAGYFILKKISPSDTALPLWIRYHISGYDILHLRLRNCISGYNMLHLRLRHIASPVTILHLRVRHIASPSTTYCISGYDIASPGTTCRISGYDIASPGTTYCISGYDIASPGTIYYISRYDILHSAHEILHLRVRNNVRDKAQHSTRYLTILSTIPLHT